MRCQTCGNALIIKKQLFKNNTVHVWSKCSVCRKSFYLARTQDNLRLANGWKNPEIDSDKKLDWDELLGLIIKEENSICGNCKNSCGDCKIKELCPCHWK